MAVKKRTYASEPLGPAIERLMAETGITYRALAEKTSLSAGYLNHIVHGNRRVPSTEVISRIGKALGVKPDYFREVRVRIIIDKLEQTPALVDRLYKRLGS
jgi:transcriptional regulator with XRE-family HTH domain